MNKPVILTGIRSNNRITIGNFFGALLPTVDLANRTTDEYQINLFVPDLHSFTTPIEHRDLYDNTINHLKLFVASGLDLNKDNVNLYRQSFIPAHSELMWILSCFTGFGELSRMTQFKDKSAKEQNITAGLFNYPILMAADILLYDASYVPVGDDQTQHLEFARDLAMKFNSRFRTEIFKVPYEVSKQHAFFNRDQGLRIKDLVDPAKKMSKSDTSEKGIIFIDEDPNSAKNKILSATTDNLANINFDPINQPGISNLLTLHSLLTKQSLDDVIKQWKGQNSYKDLKEAVANSMYEFLLDFQEKYHRVESKQLEDKLKSTENKMNEIANKKLFEVQTLVGLRKL